MFQVRRFGRIFRSSIRAIFVGVTIVARARRVRLRTLTFRRLRVQRMASAGFHGVQLPHGQTGANGLQAIRACPMVVLQVFICGQFRRLEYVVLLVCYFLVPRRDRFIFSFRSCLFYFRTGCFSGPSQHGLRTKRYPRPSPKVPLWRIDISFQAGSDAPDSSTDTRIYTLSVRVDNM